MIRPVSSLTFASLLVACSDSSSPPPPPPDQPAVANPAREIVDTKLSFDVTAHTGHAAITLGASATPGATLEVGDLTLGAVTIDGFEIQRAYSQSKHTLDLGVAASEDPITVDVDFTYTVHDNFDGASSTGYTMLWPYYCGNLFPCHSDPKDGTTFSLELTAVPSGKTAVFPTTIPADAPSYQVAWSIDDYVDTVLGTTTAGTQLVITHRTSEATAAATGGANLVAAFDWMEKTLGPYRFGPIAGTVSVQWGPGAFGGMEHHPRWHVAAGALASEETNVHEAAHGWFGDGIRIGCWEDFVLSEGTVTYLAGRALEVVAPTVGAQVWNGYANELKGIPGTNPVWPQSCGMIDILGDNLFTNAPYIRGAFFYRALAGKVGADQVDQVLATFYAAHAGGSATMTGMLQTIQQVTGYDATACANTWLKATTTPMPGPCP
ncbi:MAG TPA: M1 family aminopeptidase [Kofleriaceae bacterium]|nr:M1 family aminopeptidase [Kofleriaceae bacterium]